MNMEVMKGFHEGNCKWKNMKRKSWEIQSDETWKYKKKFRQKVVKNLNLIFVGKSGNDGKLKWKFMKIFCKCLP